MESEVDFFVNKSNKNVSICTPTDLVREYDDSFEIAVAGMFGKYLSKDEWEHIPWDCNGDELEWEEED